MDFFWSVAPQRAGVAESERDFDCSRGCTVQAPVAPARRVPCWRICAWGLDGTGCEVMRVWCTGEIHVPHPGWGVAFWGVTIDRDAKQRSAGAGTTTSTEATREHKKYAIQGPTTNLCT